jgi:hypothetical protein
MASAGRSHAAVTKPCDNLARSRLAVDVAEGLAEFRAKMLNRSMLW